MSKSKQTRYTAEQKTKILKRHLIENEPLSTLCEEFNISITTFHNWQKKLFENAPSVLESKRPGPSHRSHDIGKKAQWGEFNQTWIKMEKRDEIVAFINHWQHRSEFSRQRLLDWLQLPRGRFRSWEKRFAQGNCHNGIIPKAHWLLPEEREAIVTYASQGHLQAGYRRMSYLMLDANIVAASPSSVYRVLKQADLIQAWGKPSMTETDAQIVLQKAREAYPNQKPRLISDNGSQFTSKDFKEFISICEMTHVKTAPYYPQSNGKIERYHKSLKQEALRPLSPVDLEDAERIIGNYIEDYNNVRLHSAIGYVPPVMKLEGRDEAFQMERKEKLKKAIQNRKNATKQTL